jgi:hypothetical protein
MPPLRQKWQRRESRVIQIDARRALLNGEVASANPRIIRRIEILAPSIRGGLGDE